MSLTFRELKDLLNNLSPEQLDKTATVHDFGMDECYEVTALMVTTNEHEVLDANHPVIFFGLVIDEDTSLVEYGLEPLNGQPPRFPTEFPRK